MEKYFQCKTYPVFPALFYDYDSEKHANMIVEQLNPYKEALAGCVTKFWITFFIWFLSKTFFVPMFFRIEEAMAEKCCDAIRLKRVVKVEVAKINPIIDQHKIIEREAIRLKAQASIKLYDGDLDGLEDLDLESIKGN